MADEKKIIEKTKKQLPKEINKANMQLMPLLPLRGLSIFPYMILHFDVGRTKSIKALEEAMINNQLIFLVAQKDAMIDEPNENDFYNVGTISKVKQLLKIPGDTIRVLVEGISRAEIGQVVQREPFFMAEIIEKASDAGNVKKDEIEALKRRVIASFEEYVMLSNKVSSEAVISIMSIEDDGQLADIITSNIILKTEQKQEILSEFNTKKRLEKLLKILFKEIDILKIEKDINAKVHKQIDKMQKEYYLREQIKAIQNELGEKDAVLGETETYIEKTTAMKLPKEVEKKMLAEIDRLAKMQPGSAEGSVIRTYLDLILELPWNVSTEESIDLKKATDILERDHYGLVKVKERIIEYLAIQKLKNTIKGPILCLVGPPGTGKTSIAMSIAKALNRNYVRMSLGGVKDEAEIRGHRRTYVGAMPGRIISAIKQAGSNNPLILLDEIDKMSSDFRGDPSSAMLEVLDSEQNFAFRDHYLDVPFDLSNVLFITTANNSETIPKPLYDRMEVINLSSYTEDEKVKIAINYLIPKKIEEHGLKKNNISFDEQSVHDIINYYTRESGVRGVEREIASVCRKVAKIIVSENIKSLKITSKNLEKYLGTRKYRHEKLNEKNDIGIASGLAWTPYGGETLSIEVNVMKGKGTLELTGQLGDVMKESAKAAMTFIRSKSQELGIDVNFHNKYDIHIHIPEGAIPKDGPSAGITIATAMISALSLIPVKREVAMTGEITLRGRVLPVGGLKEKILAAHRAGISTVIIPEENKKDIEEIPDEIKNKIKIVLASDMDIVLETALLKTKKRRKKFEPDNLEDVIMIQPETIKSNVTPNAPM